MRDCKYCTQEDGWKPIKEKEYPFANGKCGFAVVIDEGRLKVYFDQDARFVSDVKPVIDTKINFCPICGGRFKEDLES